MSIENFKEALFNTNEMTISLVEPGPIKSFGDLPLVSFGMTDEVSGDNHHLHYIVTPNDPSFDRLPKFRGIGARFSQAMEVCKVGLNEEHRLFLNSRAVFIENAFNNMYSRSIQRHGLVRDQRITLALPGGSELTMLPVSTKPGDRIRWHEEEVRNKYNILRGHAFFFDRPYEFGIVHPHSKEFWIETTVDAQAWIDQITFWLLRAMPWMEGHVEFTEVRPAKVGTIRYDREC